MPKLTQKQKKFAMKYRETGNATQSYIAAGYTATGKTATVNASRLLTNANVQEYLRSLNIQSEKDSIAKSDEVMKYLTSVMRGETTETAVFLAQKTGQVVSAKKPPDESARLKAATELLKRYPSEVTQADTTVRIVYERPKDG